MVARRRQSPTSEGLQSATNNQHHHYYNQNDYYQAQDENQHYSSGSNMAVDISGQQHRRSPLHQATTTTTTSTSTSVDLPSDEEEGDDYAMNDDYYCHHHDEDDDFMDDDENDLRYRHCRDNPDSSSSPPPHATWSVSPTRNSSSSSSSLSGERERDLDNSPLQPVGEVIHIPNPNAVLLARDFPHLASSGRQQQHQYQYHQYQHQQRNHSTKSRQRSYSRGDCSNGSSNCTDSSFSTSGLSPFMIGLILIGCVAIFLSNSSVGYAVQKASELRANRDRLAQKLLDTEHDLQSLKREVMAMNALMHQKHELDDPNHHNQDQQQQVLQAQTRQELNNIRDHIKDLSHNGDALKSRVQSISRNAVESKFGPGPHYVEMELVFPVPADGGGSRHLKQHHDASGPTKFIVEMAPTTEMPHSVHTFLEMVSAGLIDGCSFILNALHVLKAAPLPYDGSLAAAKAKAFSDHGLEGVAFKEYNDKFPHLKYTMGFAADGSPSFYINTEDNTDIHVGDPCFGRIVDGVDAIQRMEAAPTRNGIWFAQKIGIKRARILSFQEYSTANRQGLRQQQQHQQQQQQQQHEPQQQQRLSPQKPSSASVRSTAAGADATTLEK
ncbi:hypothetical protein ACA910_018739 [Epithemia clementina (nom. ined.)]